MFEIEYRMPNFFSGACYYLSSTINPFLYSLLSVRFRRGFQDVLRRCCGQIPVGIAVQGSVGNLHQD